jgi:hypothetical protein
MQTQTMAKPKEMIFNIVNEMNDLQIMEIANYALFIRQKNDNKNVVGNKNANSAFGSLSKYANTNLIEKEKDAWEIYAREKYASC